MWLLQHLIILADVASGSYLRSRQKQYLHEQFGEGYYESYGLPAERSDAPAETGQPDPATDSSPAIQRNVLKTRLDAEVDVTSHDGLVAEANKLRLLELSVDDDDLGYDELRTFMTSVPTTSAPTPATSTRGAHVPQKIIVSGARIYPKVNGEYLLSSELKDGQPYWAKSDVHRGKARKDIGAIGFFGEPGRSFWCIQGALDLPWMRRDSTNLYKNIESPDSQIPPVGGWQWVYYNNGDGNIDFYRGAPTLEYQGSVLPPTK